MDLTTAVLCRECRVELEKAFSDKDELSDEKGPDSGRKRKEKSPRKRLKV